LGLEVFEVIEGVAVGAAGGIDAALEAFEVVAVVGVGLGEDDRIFGLPEVIDLLVPDLGFDGAEAAEEPFALDHGVEEGARGGAGGAVVVEVFVAEGGEVVVVLAEDDLGFGVDAGFKGVPAGGGLTLDGARASGLCSVEAIGLDLFLACHDSGE